MFLVSVSMNAERLSLGFSKFEQHSNHPLGPNNVEIATQAVQQLQSLRYQLKQIPLFACVKANLSKQAFSSIEGVIRKSWLPSRRNIRDISHATPTKWENFKQNLHPLRRSFWTARINVVWGTFRYRNQPPAKTGRPTVSSRRKFTGFRRPNRILGASPKWARSDCNLAGSCGSELMTNVRLDAVSSLIDKKTPRAAKRNSPCNLINWEASRPGLDCANRSRFRINESNKLTKRVETWRVYIDHTPADALRISLRRPCKRRQHPNWFNGVNYCLDGF